MDTAQRLISKALEGVESYQSVLNWQKTGTLYFNISEEHIQLMHKGVNHRLMSFSSNIRVKKYNRPCLYKSSVEKIRSYQLP